MEILVPITFTNAMLVSSSVPEPDTSMGESLWVSGGTYAVGVQKVNPADHYIYECVQAAAGRTVSPELDDKYWLKTKKPSNRQAMFDGLISTQTISTSTLTVVVKPGFFNCIALYSLQGDTIAVTVRNGSGGPVVYSYSGSLVEDVPDWYEWFFSPIYYKSKLVLPDLLPYDAAEITIVITPADGLAAIGLQAGGDLVNLNSLIGGTKFGAKAEPVTYSYIDVAKDGTRTIVPGNNATNLRLSVDLEQADLDPALFTLQSILGKPCAFIGSRVAGYAGLNVFGLGSSSVSYDGAVSGSIEITVDGFV